MTYPFAETKSSEFDTLSLNQGCESDHILTSSGSGLEETGLEAGLEEFGSGSKRPEKTGSDWIRILATGS